MSELNGSPSLCVISCAVKDLSKSDGRLRSQFSNTSILDMVELSHKVRESLSLAQLGIKVWHKIAEAA